MGSGRNCLDRESARKPTLRVGLVKFFGQCMCGRRFVQADQFLETSGHNIAGLRHQVFAQRAAGIGKSVARVPGTRN